MILSEVETLQKLIEDGGRCDGLACRNPKNIDNPRYRDSALKHLCYYTEYGNYIHNEKYICTMVESACKLLNIEPNGDFDIADIASSTTVKFASKRLMNITGNSICKYAKTCTPSAICNTCPYKNNKGEISNGKNTQRHSKSNSSNS